MHHDNLYILLLSSLFESSPAVLQNPTIEIVEIVEIVDGAILEIGSGYG